MYRHGDILLLPVSHTDLPGLDDRKVQSRKRVILARGEVTGHHHTLVADEGTEFDVIRSDTGDGLWLSLSEAATLTHQEHNTLNIPAGNYLLVNQREEDGSSERGFRNVLD